MISITQRLASRGRVALQSSQWTRNLSASTPVNQSFDFEVEDEEPVQVRKEPREKFVNKINLYGTVGKKPEEFGAEGKEVTIFPLLTKNYYGPYNQKQEEKNWHKIMITNQTGNTRRWALDSLNVGDKVLVTGAIYYKAVDPDNADAGRMTTIVADTTILAEKRMN